jgi:hypothetical protein
MNYRKLNRNELLAAEIFSYSYANYSDHHGNPRFDRYMPEHVKVLEQATQEKWPMSKLAETLDVEEEHAMEMLKSLDEARRVIDTVNPSEAFREMVRQRLCYMLKGKVDDEAEIDKIVIQMCYCAADLGCLLEWENSRLSDYSEWLRRDADCDYSGIGLPNLPNYRETDG